jgi:putative oxidoreductase
VAAAGVIDGQKAPYAVWLLRLTLGAAFLEHVMHNLFGYVPADIAQLIGLAPGVSPLVIAGEALAAVALLLGVWPRAAALLGALTLSVATVTASGAVTDNAFGWPHPVLWIAALVAFAFIGDGAFAIVPTPWVGAETRR